MPFLTRLTRYWFGLPAGSVVVAVRVSERHGVTLVAVEANGRHAVVPADYLEAGLCF